VSRKQEIIFAQEVGLGLGITNSDRGVGEGKDYVAFLDVTAVSGNFPTLDCKFQEWDQASEKWFDIASAVFTQAIGAGSERITFSSNALRMRLVQDIGGSATPTVDFTVGAIGTPE